MSTDQSQPGRKNAGFTLLEILIAMAILGISTGVFLNAAWSAWTETRNANHLYLAGHLIEKRIEALRIDIEKNPAAGYWPGNSTVTDGGITVSWVLSPPIDITGGGSPPADVKQLRIVAYWQTVGPESLVVETHLSRDF